MAPKAVSSQSNSSIGPKTSNGTRKTSQKPLTKAAGSAINRIDPHSAKSVYQKAASIAGESPVTGATSAYTIMANRIANRVAEMAESITFVERPKQQVVNQEAEDKRRPRKLEMRLAGSSNTEQIAFSAPFLDNTLQKMLALQNRMLKSTAELTKSKGVEEKTIKEHASQSAELSRIIAMICAEKARQGA